jgi:hypothetical protein
MIKKALTDVKYALYVTTHPFNGFWNIKMKIDGSKTGAAIILALYVITSLFNVKFSGYLFNPQYGMKVNILVEISKIAVPFILWSVSNWCFTTLMQGEGTFENIATATGYSLTPLLAYNIIMIFLSNFLTIQEGMFISVIGGMSFFIFGFLMLVNVVVIHQYTLIKAIITIFLTLLGMAVMVFLIILCFNLLQEIIDTAKSIINEIVLRIRG